MAKLKREAHVLGLAWIYDNKDYKQVIGDDIDDLSIEMNGSFEESKNILGQTRVTDTGYAPTISVESYMANTGDDIYPFLKDLALNRKSGVDSLAIYIEIILDERHEHEESGSVDFDAWVELCSIEITSYGGAAGNDLPINYTIHPCGKRMKTGGGYSVVDGQILVDDDYYQKILNELMKAKNIQYTLA